MRVGRKANLLCRDLIYKNITPSGKRGCWEWQGSRTPDGYGQVTVNYRTMRAHRLAMHLWHGHPLNGNLCVLHRCDNPPCCNPEHLFLGTIKDNVHDMYKKGRAGHQRGTLHTNRQKLSDTQVVEILQLLSANKKQTEIAALYNISHTHICNINSGKDRTKIWRKYHGINE